MEFLTIEDLRQEFLALPDETQRAYEKKIVSIGLSSKVQKFDKWVREVNELDNLDSKKLKEVFALAETGDESMLDKWLDDLMGDANIPFTNLEDDKVGFAAFATKMEKLRRNQNWSEEEKLLNKYAAKFKEKHPFFGHLEILALQDSNNCPSDLVLLEMAEANRNAMPQNAGAIHILAIAVADILEKPVIDERIKNGHWLDKGLDAVSRSISLESGYAKFYCTRARLMALKGLYEQAHADIKTAIDLEDDSKEDYALRIDYYRNVSQKITQKEQSEAIVNELKEQVKNIQEDLKKESHANLVKNMEFLGLFAGIVSFTIGGITIATAGFKASEAAGIIIILMGALLGVFSGFGAILHGFKKQQGLRNLIVFIAAVIIIVLGVVLLLAI